MRGEWYALIGSFLLGITFFLIKVGLEDRDPILFATYITLISLLLFTFYLLLTKKEINVPTKFQVKDLIYYTVIIIILRTAHYVAQSMTSVTNFSLIQKLSPFFTAIVAFYILKERLPKKIYACAIAMFVGLVLVITNGQMITPAFADLLVVVVAISFGFLNVFLKINLKHIGRLSTYFYTRSASCAFFILLSIFMFGWDLFDSNYLVPVVFAVAIINTVYHMLAYTSIKKISPTKFSAIVLLSPIFSIIPAIIFLGETISLIQIIGGAIILGGAYYLITKK